MIKYILLVLIFVSSIVFYINQKKQEEIKKIEAEQIKQEEIKKMDKLDDFPQINKDYSIKLSKETIYTLRSLTEDTNENVRLSAAELLWQMQDDKIYMIIKKMLENETESNVKVKIIDIIGKDKSKLSLKLLAEAMKNYDKDTKLRAIDYIANFTHKDALTALNPALSDYDEDVKLKAIKAINKIKKDIEQKREEKLRELDQTKPIYKVE